MHTGLRDSFSTLRRRVSSCARSRLAPQVERELYTHPAVRECCVFGLPDERLGEVVGCAVWLSEDVPPAQKALGACSPVFQAARDPL